MVILQSHRTQNMILRCYIPMYLLHFGDIPNLVSCAFSTIPIFLPFNSQNLLVILCVHYPHRTRTCTLYPRKYVYTHVHAHCTCAVYSVYMHDCTCMFLYHVNYQYIAANATHIQYCCLPTRMPSSPTLLAS